VLQMLHVLFSAEDTVRRLHEVEDAAILDDLLAVCEVATVHMKQRRAALRAVPPPLLTPPVESAGNTASNLPGVHESEASALAAIASEGAGGCCTFYFMDAEYIRSSTASVLPSYQELRTMSGVLVPRSLNSGEANRSAYERDFVAVSHRWETPNTPDPSGAQLCALRAYLESHRQVKYVWVDYHCMPQGAEKTAAERVRFRWMLQSVNLLYLGCSVLILMDISYLSRFWVRRSPASRHPSRLLLSSSPAPLACCSSLSSDVCRVWLCPPRHRLSLRRGSRCNAAPRQVCGPRLPRSAGARSSASTTQSRALRTSRSSRRGRLRRRLKPMRCWLHRT
jgi:hypothetical protein